MGSFDKAKSILRYIPLFIIIALLLIYKWALLTTYGCDSSQNVSEKCEVLEVSQINRFEIINVDNSGILNVGDVDEHVNTNYAYLTDTGVVYVGIGFENFVNNSWCAPVISPKGNYYIYNTETKSVEEIIK